MLFSKHTAEFWRDLFMGSLPPDILWDRRVTSNLSKLLLGVASSLNNIEDKIVQFINNYPPSITDIFLNEWERIVGIPDDCITVATTDDERRKNILFKIRAVNITTEQDFIDLATVLGFTITIVQGSSSDALPPYDIPYFGNALPARSGSQFVWTVIGATNATLRCVFRKLKPAHSIVEFIP